MKIPQAKKPFLRGWRRAFGHGSLTGRMIFIAAVWIGLLLAGGGFALDRVLTSAITRNFDAQLNYALTAMIGAAEIGPDGEVRFTRSLGDQRFLEPYSGLYWQVSTPGEEPFRSRSLWDRALAIGSKANSFAAVQYDDFTFRNEPLRLIMRDARLPGSPKLYRFQVAENRLGLDQQIRALRTTLVRSFFLLGFGLFALAVLQAIFGLMPLRRVRRAIVAIRSGKATRVSDDFPPEVAPLVEELNALLAYNEEQAEAARHHAGNLAHALKTPMSVLMNEAMARAPDLADSVIRETSTMRRQVNHHLARARAIGRRAELGARAGVWPSLTAVERAVSRMYDSRVLIDMTGDRQAVFRGERQDLEELLGNLIENAAKYGGGRVFVTVESSPGWLDILIEDDGPGIPEAKREELFQRGARLDTTKPGTGLGLSIARDVAEIYGGSVTVEDSEDLGGLLVRLHLPAAEGS